jgi:hypothetical protein
VTFAGDARQWDSRGAKKLGEPCGFPAATFRI